MKLSAISIGNLRRRKAKTVLLSAGLSIGIAMVVAMTGITLKMKADVERKLDEYGANIIVTPKSESLALSYGGVGVTEASYDEEELNASDAETIRHIEAHRNLSAVAPKLLGSVKIGQRSFLAAGVDFKEEFLIKKWWRLQGRIPASAGEVIIGSRVAQATGASAGGTLDISGESFKVSGVLEENASQDDLGVFMSLFEAQRLLAKEGKISMIEVSALCSACPIEDIVAQIGAMLPHAKVSAVRQAMALRMQTAGQFMRFSIAVSVVVLAIGSLIVFVSMLSSVNERTKEIGILRAIGYRRSHIVKIILMEAFAVSLASGALGWVLGSLSVSFLAPGLMGIEGVSFNPLMLAGAASLSVLVGMSSSIYPALKASRLEPIEALRYI